MMSIIQNNDGRCYLCQLLNQDFGQKNNIEEHHAIFGTAQRQLSERYGLKVYLCVLHHRTGPNAVHKNKYAADLIKDIAQRRFDEGFPNLNFREIFGKNYYMTEEEKAECIKKLKGE